MPTKLDSIDRKILGLLQEDGRKTIAELAEQVGLSPSPCLRRVRMLEEAGVVSRYVAVLDQQSVGLPVSVFISIKLESQREEALDRFAKAIQRWPEVLECYLMTGPRDYLLRVVVADLAAYERFLKQKLTKLSGIGSIEFELRARTGQIHQRAAVGVTERHGLSNCIVPCTLRIDLGATSMISDYLVLGLIGFAAQIVDGCSRHGVRRDLDRRACCRSAWRPRRRARSCTPPRSSPPARPRLRTSGIATSTGGW